MSAGLSSRPQNSTMDILGIGPLELLFIALIAIIVLGPRDLARIARSSGRFLNKIYRSEAWSTLTRASRDIRNLPNKLAREAALEELDQTIREGPARREKQPNDALQKGLEAWRPSDDEPAPTSRPDNAESSSEDGDPGENEA